MHASCLSLVVSFILSSIFIYLLLIVMKSRKEKRFELYDEHLNDEFNALEEKMHKQLSDQAVALEKIRRINEEQR